MSRRSARRRTPGRATTTHVRPVTPPSRVAWALLAIAIGGVLLRLLQVGHDLPWFMEEALPLRHALAGWMAAGHPDWNPHRFHYPSLVYDLHLLTQMALRAVGGLVGRWTSDADFLLESSVDPTASVLLARTLHVLADGVTIWAAGRAGERLRPGAGMIAALVVASSGAMIRGSRLVQTDTFLATFAMLAIERTLAWRAHGGTARLAAAALCVGLAAGAKYPGIALLLPLAVEIVRRERGRAMAPLLVTVLIAFGTFLATTPYALLDARTFVRDLGFVGRMAGEGHLGDFDRPGFAFHLGNLIRDLGIAGVVATVAAFARMAVAHGEAAAVRPVALAFAVFAIPIAVARIEAERYLIPIVPLVAVLGAWGVLAWCAALPQRARRVAVPAAAALLVAPVLWNGATVARAGATSTQVEAARWFEDHVDRRALVLSELYGPPLTGRADQARLEEHPMFQAASAGARQRAQSRRTFAFVLLPAATTGSITNPVRGATGEPVLLEVARQAADLNGASYDPRLLDGVAYVVTSSAMRGRFAADSARFPMPNRLYALLDRTARVAARFDPHGPVDGPGIVVYQLGDSTRAAIAALGPLDGLWWADAIPAAYRERAQSVITGASAAGTPARAADGTPAAWVHSLTPVFAERFAGFATAMAIEHRLGDRPAQAWPFACALLEMEPANAGAYFTLAWSAHERGAWREALPWMRRSLEAQAQYGALPPEARGLYEYALTQASGAAPPAGRGPTGGAPR